LVLRRAIAARRRDRDPHGDAELLEGVEDSTALYRYVATNQPLFGQLEVFKTRAGETCVRMWLLVLADYLDEQEFRDLVVFMCNQADALDDSLQTLFGGRRASDS
jgi:hypothetical protein